MENIDATIAGIYRAAAGKENWNEALLRLALALRAHNMQMVGVNRSNGAIMFSHFVETVESIGRSREQDYVRQYFALDPRVPKVMSRTVDFFERSPFYRDFLLPAGGKYSAGARLYADESEKVFMAVATPISNARFNENRRSYLERIAPHLSEAVGLFRHSPWIARGNAVDAELMERTGKSIFLIDVGRRITAVNSPGRKFLVDSHVLKNRNGHLAAVHAKDEQALTEAMLCIGTRQNLSWELSKEQSKEQSKIRLQELSKEDARQIVRFERADVQIFAASLIKLAPNSSMNTLGPSPQFMLTIHRAPDAARSDIALWQAAFDLTPAEARVAAKVFHGTAMPAAAENLGISYHTANSHLDHIFTKTNTHRQAQLMKALMSVMA